MKSSNELLKYRKASNKTPVFIEETCKNMSSIYPNLNKK